MNLLAKLANLLGGDEPSDEERVAALGPGQFYAAPAMSRREWNDYHNEKYVRDNPLPFSRPTTAHVGLGVPPVAQQQQTVGFRDLLNSPNQVQGGAMRLAEDDTSDADNLQPVSTRPPQTTLYGGLQQGQLHDPRRRLNY